MQKWNIPNDRTQRLDEKNGVICLVFMFNPRVMVIKMLKMTHFQIFCLWKEDIIEYFLKMVWLIGFGVTFCEILRVEI